MVSFHILIIGLPSLRWAHLLGGESPALAIETARLPSAGIRQFEETPSDLIIIADEKGGPRVETLAHAIRKRPLGELTPILILAPRHLDDEELSTTLERLDLIGWLPLDAPAPEVCALIDAHFELDLFAASAHSSSLHKDTESSDPPALLHPDNEDSRGRVSYFDGEVILEPLDPPTAGPIRSVSLGSIFRSTTTENTPGALQIEELKRKLKAVRHEDYYAILELRRGAEGQLVREAFHRLQARFDPARLPFEIAHTYHHELDEIRDAFEDAFAVLGDPELREPYLRHTVK